jgi:hypothetical protein
MTNTFCLVYKFMFFFRENYFKAMSVDKNKRQEFLISSQDEDIMSSTTISSTKTSLNSFSTVKANVPTRSSVWSHFTIKDGRSYCNYCE